MPYKHGVCPFFFMNIEDRTLIEVRCTNRTNGRFCGHYIGYFDTEGTHAGIYYCSHCNMQHIYTVDEFGMVRRRSTKKKLNFKTLKSVAVAGDA